MDSASRYHFVELSGCAAPLCQKAPTREVRTPQNALIGRFCTPHAEVKVRDLNDKFVDGKRR